MELSPATRRQHESILNVLEEKGHIERKDGKVIVYPCCLDYILGVVVNPGTRKNYLAALLRVATGTEEELKPFRELQKKTHEWLNNQRIQQTLPHHRLDQMLTWAEVLGLRNKATAMLSPEEYLIYCLYTLTPPVRCDYWNMKVVKYLTEKCKTDKKWNYCAIHKNDAFFQFNVYKTSSTYGPKTFPVSDELFAVLKDRPCGRLLETVDTANKLSKAVVSIFEKLAGKSMGIGLLRHSYITTFLSQPRRLVERIELAEMMFHSWTTQEEYHIIENDTDGDSG